MGELENNDNLFNILVKILKFAIGESLRKLYVNTLITFKYIHHEMRQLSSRAFVCILCFELLVFAAFSKSYIIAHLHILFYSSVVIYTYK